MYIIEKRGGFPIRFHHYRSDISVCVYLLEIKNPEKPANSQEEKVGIKKC